MGQYYRTAIKTNSKIEVFQNRGGIKLMEHSWLDDNFVNCMAKMLYKTKCKVAWVGDYAIDMKNLPNKITKDKIATLYYKVWNDDFINKVCECEFKLENKFILNHTKKQFLDCNKYIANSADDNGQIIHPLPLLTAIGNGLGGGDFNSPQDEKMLENVGIWAWDMLEITDKKPTNYKEFECAFIKRW